MIKTSFYEHNNLQQMIKANDKGWIVKPDSGVGCESISVCYSVEEIKKAANNCEQAIVQPKVEGLPASISLLCNQGECLIVGYNEQIIKVADNKLSLVGLKVNALHHFQAKLEQLAKQVCLFLPELKGYIGIDVIITEDEIMFVEINPRMTTSYVGLKDSINANPAKLLLDMLFQNKLPTLDSSKFKTVTVNI